MRPFTSNIGKGRHYVSREFMLHIEMPLLYVRPLDFGGNRARCQGQLRGKAAGSDVVVSGDLVLLGRIGQGWRVFERLRVALVPIGVLVENSVSAADGGLTVTPGIPGETDPRSRVKDMTLHAACWNPSCDPALNDPIGQVRNRGRQP